LRRRLAGHVPSIQRPAAARHRRGGRTFNLWPSSDKKAKHTLTGAHPLLSSPATTAGRPPKIQRLKAVLPEVWKLMRPRRALLALGFVLMVVNRLAGFVLPYSSKFLIDDVVGKHHTQL